MRGLLRLILVSQAVLASQFLMAAEPANAPKGVDVIWGYAGTWEVETEHFDTTQSKAGHEKATLHNACWKNGAYLACNQYVDGDSKILLVFTYSEKSNTYTSYQIPQDGGQSGSGKLLVDGNVWTFPWQVTDAGKTTWFRVVNVFDTPDKIEFRQEFSPDNVHWTVTAKGLETRVAGA
jgi:hypothetical protein